ncbi:MAG: exodeoxyribonuclease VII small subunit [Bifidobacteriaceae bacterium]|jgi:exodeoxyribonuclease VII small subunit|nr:exodeoxyribonuclease VII small subunit [Bifidobacteriaceae bacterium]
MSAPIPVEELSYEAARAELVQVVQQLEAGSQTLEQAMALWERGEALAARCQEWLDAAKARIEARRPPRPSQDPPAAN